MPALPTQPVSASHSRVMWRRWGAWASLVGMVIGLHVWVTQEVVSRMQAETAAEPDMVRMEAAYVSELKLTAPPVARAAAPAPLASRRQRPRVARAALAASAPASEAASATDDAASSKQASTTPDAETSASSPMAAASAASHTALAQTAPAAPKAPPFIWPKATKVSFTMTGHYRGPISGRASVEWVRQDNRYQVHVDTTIGPDVAPFGAWKLSSEGVITADGLSPKRYVNVTRLLIKTNAPKTVVFEDDEVVLPSGERSPRQPGMQDPASQFIQLAYRFITRPELLKVGNAIEMPMVTLKKTETLVYTVVGEEWLDTPLGKVPTFHVKPRLLSASPGAPTAEIWFAPSLQYLPVRILAHLDDQSYMDMQMEKAPQQVPGGTGPGGDYDGP